jgi:hypothetical protein
MHARRLASLLVLAAFPTAALAARQPAAVPPSELSASAVSRLDPQRQAALDRSPTWASFQSRHGAWRTLWNERTATPHLAIGPAIALTAAPRDAESVDRSLRAFMTANAALLGGQHALRTVRVSRAGRVWYASYRREVHGIPVLFEDWEFRVSEEGRLMAFGVDAHPFPAGIQATPALDAHAAREAARAALKLMPDSPVLGGETLWWLPDERPGGSDHRLVREVRARTANPPGSWIVLVDAITGAIAWRHDRVRYQVSGTASGTVHLDLPTGVPASRPFVRQWVDVNGFAIHTDAAGAYSSFASGAVTVSAAIQGLFCDVNRSDAPDAMFSVPTTAPATVNIHWEDTNSHAAERDGYYHVNVAHAHYKTLDPAFTGNDYPMPCQVNIPQVCNAFWDGTGINFYTAGGGCPNTATMPDVVYHEYGHGVNDNLYIQLGSSFGMINSSLHEGFADILAAFIQDSPEAGKGFTGPGTLLRTLDNTNRWPEDSHPDPHVTGLILGGAFWDLRQELGLALAQRLSHFAKYGLPDDGNAGVAMSEVFVQTLVADDDDGNLNNGTPHDEAIVAAFNAHGIGTGNFLAIGHNALDDQFSSGPYQVIASIQYSGPIGAVDPTSPQVHYSVNGGPYGTLPMTSLGFSEYGASIPAPTGTIVRYYITVSDTYGQQRSHPLDPSSKPHLFLAGATSSFQIWDHESDAGWTSGLPTDDATTGQWEWDEPDGSFIGGQPVQPDNDHTSYGMFCYFTQNPFIDISPGAHDVDDGRTTLTTGMFDVTLAGPYPLIEYWRWYTNHLGASPGGDPWRVEISNDGGDSWTPVENTTTSDNSWRRVVFFVHDFLTPTTQMMLRFIAEDVDPPSLVEAAVDDTRVLAFNSGVTSAAPGQTQGLALAAPSPNPSGAWTKLRFTLSEVAEAKLSIYDLSGRRVRMLWAGRRGPGSHTAVWDGRDHAGQPVASGLYLARLEALGQERTQRIVRTR